MDFSAWESQLAKIQIYIAVTIAAAHITSLVGFNFTGNLSVCSAVAAVLQYLFTVYAIWLVVHTAVLLHTCYVHGKPREYSLIAVKAPKGENTEKVGLVRIFLAAWGAPLIVVVILFTEIPYAFGTPESCWLLFTELVYKTFLASVWFAAMVNLVLACVTGYYFQKTESQSKANDDEYAMWLDRLWSRLRLYLPSSVILTFTLATTWTFHALYKMNPLMTYQYLFQVFNMSQGTLMFVFFCMLNPEVRTVIYRGSRSRLTNDNGTSTMTNDNGTSVMTKTK
ncbi:adhesion G-protein coupled receptor D1-like [Diadema antillarum]|uniref:adhesion G-protein coupled receptor D1-like n=1 Tax=Diadema antillarum TaxID=105358 RepID=UPI003A8A06BA